MSVIHQQLLEDVPVDTSTRANRKQPKEQDTMVATRKSKVLPEPVSATDSADADSEETQNFNYERKQGLSRLRLGKSTDIENVRVWPLCFAIAIEKSRRIRPGIMVASSSLLAGVSYHLHESDSELLVRFRVHLRPFGRASR